MKTKLLPRIRNAAAGLLAVALLSHSAQAITYYWDTNDTAAGSGNATGTWDSSVSTLFSQTANGTATTTANTTTSADTLTFSAGNGGASVAQQNGTPGTITVSGNQVIGTMSLNQSDLVFSGGNVTVTTLVVNANATISSKLANNTNLRFDTAGQTLTLSGGGSNHRNITGNSDAIALASTLVLDEGIYSTEQNQNTQYNIGNITAETGGVVINSGATLSQPLGTSSFQIGNAREGLVTVNAGGNLTVIPAGNLLVGRGAGNGGKLLVNGGNVTVLAPVSIGFAMTANSTNTVTVSSGSLSTGSDIGISVQTTSGAAASMNSTLNISGGTVTTGAAKGVLFGGATGFTNSTVGTGTLTMTGGSLYVGTGGITKNGTGSYAVGGVNLSGGTVGALGNWSSNLDMTLGTTNGAITFQSGNQTGTAYNITLSGNLSGTGGLIKSGTGNLTLSGTNAYAGNTTVTAGTMVLASATTLQSATGDVSVGGGALTASVATTTLGGNLAISSGILDTATTGVGTFNLASGKTFSMSGGTWNLNITGDSTFDKIVSVSGTPAFSITAGTIDLTGGTINYLATYGILSGFGTGTVGSFSIQGYDTTNYLASLGADGNLAFTAVPEPGTWMLVAVGGLLLIAAPRRAIKTA